MSWDNTCNQPQSTSKFIITSIINTTNQKRALCLRYVATSTGTDWCWLFLLILLVLPQLNISTNNLDHHGLVTPYVFTRQQTWVDIGSGNALVLSGNKPLPEWILTYQWGSVTITLGEFHNTYLNNWLKLAWDSCLKYPNQQGANELKCH